MARQQERVSTKASIPKRILVRNSVDIVNDSALKDSLVTNYGIKLVFYDHHHTERKEKKHEPHQDPKS
ncbi:hypothetical protein TIFTF001_001687 [Ficus carica]|uniref:Uncharacterized protein n=1 Tax=Ficus carica TaxID=3494 RepID=A0AA87Z2S7_FICCA|nr:hypothetical protein TIFTF001_001687 [Ficus carica]